MFEIVDGKLATRFNWLERDDVVEEVFSDRVNDLLWLRHERIDKLIRYDGEAWAFVPVPAAFDTRGDRLRGFQMFNSDDALYVSSSTSLWKWDASRNAWQPVELPKLNCKGEDPGNDIRCFAGASASGRTVIAAVRHGTLAFIDALIPEKADSEQTDVLCFRDGEEWKKVPGTEDRFFFVKKLIADSGRAYLLTRSNQLFSVGPDGLSEIPSPGEVETIAASSSGTLIASVKDKGIFELTTQWEKRANTKTVGPRGLPYLAENNGRIAFGITYWDGGTTDTCNINEEVSIWVIERGSELCIE